MTATARLGPHDVRRVGFGAMQLPGPGVYGPPRDREEALAVLRRAREAGVDHIASRLGPEHVALGSDFDGCELPEGIAGAQDLPLVLDDLRALGWAEPELRLVAHANFLRVLLQVQNAASSRASPTGSS